MPASCLGGRWFLCRRPPAQVQLEPIKRATAGAAGQLAPKYTGMIQAVRTIVREEGVLVRTAIAALSFAHQGGRSPAP